VTATAAMLARLRRMVDEPTTTTYSDVVLSAYIEEYPLIDERGLIPYYFRVIGSGSAAAPDKVTTTGWLPTYDLNGAAADIWDEKAAAVAEDFSFDADGGKFSRNEVFEQYQAKARAHRSRKVPKSMPLKSWEESTKDGMMADGIGEWIGNLAEDL